MKNINLFDIEKKIIVITGSNGFLGKEFVKHCLEQKATVIGIDKKNDLKMKNFHFYKCDLEKKKSINSVYAKISKKFKKINALINNAAMNESVKETKGHNFLKTKKDNFEKFVNINLRAILILSKKFNKNLKFNKSATIINISSIYGVLAPDNNLYNDNQKIENQKNISYTVTKTAVIGLTKHLATIFAPDQIRVNCISPGGVFSNQDKYFVKKYSKKTLLNKMAGKSDFNGLIQFLVSDASSYITGENIICDGGYSIT